MHDSVHLATKISFDRSLNLIFLHIQNHMDDIACYYMNFYCRIPKKETRNDTSFTVSYCIIMDDTMLDIIYESVLQYP